jgi:hypothetical protein
MPPFFIDNTRIEAGYSRIYKVENPVCPVCQLALSNEKFYKDEYGNPYYFQCLSKDTAVMFCGAVHCSDWATNEEYKKLIWNKKDST